MFAMSSDRENLKNNNQKKKTRARSYGHESYFCLRSREMPSHSKVLMEFYIYTRSGGGGPVSYE